MTAFGFALLELACVLLIIVALELLHALRLQRGKANSLRCSDCVKARSSHSHKQHINVSDISDKACRQ